MLVNILILFFLFILCYQLFAPIKEGLDTEFKQYDQTDPMILAQQNAGNIVYLKERVDEIIPLKQQIVDLSSQVTTLTNEVLGLTQQQADYATDLVGDTVPTITGI